MTRQEQAKARREIKALLKEVFKYLKTPDGRFIAQEVARVQGEIITLLTYLGKMYDRVRKSSKTSKSVVAPEPKGSRTTSTQRQVAEDYSLICEHILDELCFRTLNQFEKAVEDHLVCADEYLSSSVPEKE